MRHEQTTERGDMDHARIVRDIQLKNAVEIDDVLTLLERLDEAPKEEKEWIHDDLAEAVATLDGSITEYVVRNVGFHGLDHTGDILLDIVGLDLIKRLEYDEDRITVHY